MPDPSKSKMIDSAPKRMRGRITTMRYSERGYTFLQVRKDLPNFFLLRSDVPPKFWMPGVVIEFTPAPPRPGTHHQRAANPVPVALLRAHCHSEGIL